MKSERTTGKTESEPDASIFPDGQAILDILERTKRAASRHPNQPENIEEKQNPVVPTPQLEDDEGYILTAFGDISLSNIDFVPGPNGVLSPTPDSKRKKAKHQSPSKYPVPHVIRRVLPPSPSKASIARPELSFEDMVMDLKSRRFRAIQNSSPTATETSSSKLAPGPEVVCPQPRRLIDMKNLGREAVLSALGSDGADIENGSRPKKAEASETAVEKDENAASGPIPIPKHKQAPLRGSAKLPRRPPIPRWDVDNSAQGKINKSLVFVHVVLALSSVKALALTEVFLKIRLEASSSEFMNLSSQSLAVEEEDDWEIVTADWWHTSYSAVPWSYNVQQDPGDKKRTFRGSVFYGKTGGTSSSLPKSRGGRRGDADTVLNPDLVGVKAAMDAVTAYECAVGFDYLASPTIEPHELDPSALGSLLSREEGSKVWKERWDEQLEGLMHGHLSGSMNDSDESLSSSLMDSRSSLEDFLRCPSTLSSIDFTSSEGSIDSIGMPSTPKAKSSFNDIEIKDLSPSASLSGSGIFNPISPGRSLNASATSFVPNFCPQLNEEPSSFASLRDVPPPSFSDFTFPTLNVPSVKIQKDDQGFFTEVQIEKAGNLLPAFLQEPSQRTRTRKSRTRQIVDRLRAEADEQDTKLYVNGVSPKYASHSPSPMLEDAPAMPPRRSVSEDGGERPSGLSTPEDDDGWIDIANTTSSPSQKAKRTRELFRALTRRRTDSLTDENLKELMNAVGNDGRRPSLTVSSSPSPSSRTPPPGPAVSTDGWIETNTDHPKSQPHAHGKKAKGQTNSKEGHHRKKSSTHNNHGHNHTHSSRTSVSSASASVPHHPPNHLPASATPFTSHQYHHSHGSPVKLAVGSQAAGPGMPYFFSPYPPAVTMPMPYPATFMQIPANYPLGMAPVSVANAVQYMPTPVPTSFVPINVVPSRPGTKPHATVNGMLLPAAPGYHSGRTTTKHQHHHHQTSSSSAVAPPLW
ncbi:unnamed protein product [Cyclocybe aegerita]|uniref:Uncharacterized protein n=1 Tax=Cyclocybe aegerita TaxID=1973307 RepID=A0A8S0WLQ5_CYCAE|nr:unnamed protein product [Cyclocybe aegerita]